MASMGDNFQLETTGIAGAFDQPAIRTRKPSITGRVNHMKCKFRLTGLATLLCVASFAMPGAHAQPTDALRKQFLEFKAQAEQGNAKAQDSLCASYHKGQGVATNYVEAVKWYRKASGQNHAQGQFNLGWCYANGQGVATNYVEAVKWYRKA